MAPSVKSDNLLSFSPFLFPLQNRIKIDIFENVDFENQNFIVEDKYMLLLVHVYKTNLE